MMRCLLNFFAAALILWSSAILGYDDSVKSYRTAKHIKQTRYTLKKTECFKLYIKKNFVEAMEVCRRLSNNNDPDAQYLIARMYYEGAGVDKNIAMAKKWYLKAAKNGQVNAQVFIASMYWLGFYMKRSLQDAKYWYTRAANKGNAPAQYVLSTYYRDLATKDGSNYSKMFYWLKKAVDQHYPVALYEIAKCYYFGIGVPIDDKKSFNYMKRAAEGGGNIAFYALGKMYEYGHGVDVNLKKALFWYKKAAAINQDAVAKKKVMLLSPNM